MFAAASRKIVDLDQLETITADCRKTLRRVVQCHGVFDLLHIGHIRYLQRAKTLGDVLIVTVTSDDYVNKGPHRPAFSAALRADALAALDCVDYVAISHFPTAVELINRLRPDVYCKGAEFAQRKTPELLEEEAAAASIGSLVQFIDEVQFSSSRLINKYLSPFPPEVQTYLQDFRTRHTPAGIGQALQKARGMRPLVVGETIIDEYYRCSTLGKSSKAPVISTRYESHERYAGGALAIANHLAGFCGEVALCTMLGDVPSEDEWLRTQLAPGIALSAFRKADAPTIVKRRYLESYFGTALFSVNFLNDHPLTDRQSDEVCELLRQALEQSDIVIVADYGHSMLSPRAIDLLCASSRFLAVNTQANAANAGFHTVSKYRRANYVSLAETELELECRSRNGDPQQMLLSVASRLDLTAISVTLGKCGSLLYHRREGFTRAPAVALKIVDRVGAGDAYFALSALGAALELPSELIAFLGNVAGAELCAVLGNSQCIQRPAFERHIESLLK